MLSDLMMSDLVADRIERALARIEAAAAKRAYAAAQLERRHARLRGRIETAIADLDELIARENEAEPEAGADADADAALGAD
ncbi:hypothetical protein ATB93_16390 [Sphingomonas sp. WG]|nr:hypothetical protein ATB93_16390 [Sphingomonas sp. WG]